MLEMEDLSFIGRDFSTFENNTCTSGATDYADFVDQTTVPATYDYQHYTYGGDHHGHLTNHPHHQGYYHAYPGYSAHHSFATGYGEQTYYQYPHQQQYEQYFYGYHDHSIYGVSHEDGVFESKQVEDDQLSETTESYSKSDDEVESPAADSGEDANLKATESFRMRFTPTSDGINKMTDNELRNEEMEMEKESEVAKHKHRKGTVCPRCKVEQRLKQVRRLIQKRTMQHFRQRSASAAFAQIKNRRRFRRTSEPCTPTGAQKAKVEPSIQPVCSSFTAFSSEPAATRKAL